MKLFVAFLMCVTSSLALAGGTSWVFKANKLVSSGNNRWTLHLEQTEDNARRHPTCAKMVVELRFETERFKRTWSDRLATRETFESAIRELKAAVDSGADVKFGEMGIGLLPVAGKTCVFLSRGLGYVVEHSGERVIYSFHSPI
jgi:hypothetical protein